MTAADDPFELARFVAAQAPVIARVREELAAGDKRSHWMWFVFPQWHGLGRSAMAARYAIGSLAEARAYLAHPMLGLRLAECTRLVLGVTGRDAHQIFGSPDDLKFCSSMTLFDHVAAATDGQASVFARALAQFFGGRRDARTLAALADPDPLSR